MRKGNKICVHACGRARARAQQNEISGNSSVVLEPKVRDARISSLKKLHHVEIHGAVLS